MEVYGGEGGRGFLIEKVWAGVIDISRLLLPVGKPVGSSQSCVCMCVCVRLSPNYSVWWRFLFVVVVRYGQPSAPPRRGGMCTRLIWIEVCIALSRTSYLPGSVLLSISSQDFFSTFLVILKKVAARLRLVSENDRSIDRYT